VPKWAWLLCIRSKTCLGPVPSAIGFTPYLLRGLPSVRPDQVWGVDITYIRLKGGFLYLVAFLDWFSRRVMAWELSNTVEMPFVLSCAEAALGQAVPEIINSDQGSHFTSERYTSRIRIRRWGT
jgi:putative transposase